MPHQVKIKCQACEGFGKVMDAICAIYEGNGFVEIDTETLCDRCGGGRLCCAVANDT
jgi:hypothetical protein